MFAAMYDTLGTILYSTNMLFSSQFIGRWCQTFVLVLLLIVILIVIRWLTTDWGIKCVSQEFMKK